MAYYSRPGSKYRRPYSRRSRRGKVSFSYRKRKMSGKTTRYNRRPSTKAATGKEVRAVSLKTQAKCDPERVSWWMGGSDRPKQSYWRIPVTGMVPKTRFNEFNYEDVLKTGGKIFVAGVNVRLDVLYLTGFEIFGVCYRDTIHNPDDELTYITHDERGKPSKLWLGCPPFPGKGKGSVGEPALMTVDQTGVAHPEGPFNYFVVEEEKGAVMHFDSNDGSPFRCHLSANPKYRPVGEAKWTDEKADQKVKKRSKVFHDEVSAPWSARGKVGDVPHDQTLKKHHVDVFFDINQEVDVCVVGSAGFRVATRLELLFGLRASVVQDWCPPDASWNEKVDVVAPQRAGYVKDMLVTFYYR